MSYRRTFRAGCWLSLRNWINGKNQNDRPSLLSNLTHDEARRIAANIAQATGVAAAIARGCRGSCFRCAFMMTCLVLFSVVVIRYKTSATARWTLMFVVSAFISYTVAVAVRARFCFHVLLMRSCTLCGAFFSGIGIFCWTGGAALAPSLLDIVHLLISSRQRYQPT
jgi:hypothetical protein